MNYKEIDGDLIELSKQGMFDVITHGCNCQNVQKSGLAPQMVKAFRTDTFKLEGTRYKGDVRKLGNIDSEVFHQEKDEYGGKQLTVINSYTQYKYGKNHEDGVDSPLDYEALTLCLRKINHLYPKKTIGLPYVIGCGLAGGDKERVIEIIKRELKDMDIIMIKYDKK